ncbi:MAG: hypothetical protein LBU24_02585 [Methanocalculaceae archaeon]|nr:hypothetical protein [Methanocalculaceae archaeon]
MPRDLVHLEGVGVEPFSAASVAGVCRLAEQDMLDPSEKIVCVVTATC